MGQGEKEGGAAEREGEGTKGNGQGDKPALRQRNQEHLRKWEILKGL